MIISLDGYGKILHEKSVAKKIFLNRFSYNRYYYDESVGRNGNNTVMNFTDEYLEDEEGSFRDTKTGMYRKVNHNDLPSLISSEKDKRSLLFTEVAGGYHNVKNPDMLYGEFSTTVWDVFVYLRSLFGKEYQIILVKPNSPDKEVQLSDNTYWGVASFDGNFLFSSNLRDNLPTNYGREKNGYGVKFLVRDSTGNEIEVAKVEAIYEYNNLSGINFEIDEDAVAAARLGKSKVLYGSYGYTEEVKEFSLGDMYKEKMIDALMGVIGTYSTKKEIDLSDENFIKIYLEVIASVCIIRDIKEDELRSLIINIMRGLKIFTPDLLNYIVELVNHQEELILDEAYKKTSIYGRGHTLKSLAIATIQKRENIQVRKRSIKKPQE